MDIQEEKADFEAEFRKTDFYKMNLVNCFCFINDRYVWDEVQAAWEMWQASKAQAVQECTWSRNEDYYFDTSCGNSFMFTECEDKPSEHQFKHCCYCGGKLIEAQEQSHD